MYVKVWKNMKKYVKVCWYGMYVKYIKAYQFNLHFKYSNI